MAFSVHSPDTAPDGARETLDRARAAYGFVPNLLGVMAEAPALAEAYLTLSGLFDETSLTTLERQVVLLTVSRENGCEYCVAAHSVVAGMQGAPADVVAALRGGEPLEDHRLEALRRFTSTLVNSRGWASDEDVHALLRAGYTRRHVLEVVLGVGLKTLSNYTNHLAETPLDAAFAQAAWARSS